MTTINNNISSILSKRKNAYSSETFTKFTCSLFQSLIKSINSKEDAISIDFLEPFLFSSKFIATKLISTVNRKGTNLTQEQFTSLLMKMYQSSMKEFETFLFDFLDFDHDGKINMKDILLLCYHFHYMSNSDFENKNNFDLKNNLDFINISDKFKKYFISYNGKISKYMYIVNVFLELLFILKLHNFGYAATFVIYIIILLNIALLLMKPSWGIEEVPLIVTKEEKEEILEKNKEFTENYIPKDKKILNIFFYILPFIIGIISVIINTFPLSNQSNDRNTSIDQIKIIVDYINIRSNDADYSDEKGIVRKDDIYDVLDSREGSNELCEIWYNIETRFKVNGWICGKFDNKDYVEVLEKE